MLHPDEIRDRTIEFRIQPAPDGIGYEVIVIRRCNKSRYSVCYRNTLGGVSKLIKKTATNFYSEETDALERRCDADPDVAKIMCPECSK